MSRLDAGEESTDHSASPGGDRDDASSASTTASPVAAPRPEPSIPETLISLILAFVIAMAFRGFVLEGFVIPTGSMAPTLLGEHGLWRSPKTGYVYATDTGDRLLRDTHQSIFGLADPMLGGEEPYATYSRSDLRRLTRPGDRVLVRKWLYTFFEPDRYDVVVFKDPTDVTRNFIKRLVGLPGEELWLADGDVYTRPAGDGSAAYGIRRKPEHVQRAVWRAVYNSEYVPLHADADADAGAGFTPPWRGPRWRTDAHRAYRCDTAQPTILVWDARRWPIDDRSAYNMLHDNDEHFAVSDVRVAAGVAPDAAGLRTSFELRARAHVYEFRIEAGEAIVRYRSVDAPEFDWAGEARAPVGDFPPGETTNLEFWHVDQSMAIFIDGERVVELEYEWAPAERLRLATGRRVEEVLAESRAAHPWMTVATPSAAELEWRFAGSPVTLHRVRLDRDLYYRPALTAGHEPGVGTHPERTAVLGADHFFVLGDNSPWSHDARVWGEPDDLIAEQISPAPFVVHRKLLVGEAWCVYFPAPYALREGGARFIPDFGRVRFIR